MSIAQIVLSDLHLGARDSLLTHVNAASEIIDGPSRVLSAFAEGLRATLRDQAATSLASDIYQALANDIRARAGIELDQAAINAVHSSFQ